MNTRTTTVTALLITCVALPLGAAQHWELTGGVIATDWEAGDTTAVQGGATYFVDPLTLSSPEPLAEAEFIERPRAWHVDAGYSSFDRPDFEFSTSSDESLRLGLAYTHRRSSSPHAFRFGYEYSSTWGGVDYSFPSTPPFGYDFVEDNHDIEVGYRYYLLPRLSVGVDARVSMGDAEYKFGIDRFYSDREAREAAMVARWLQPLGAKFWLAVEGHYGYGEEERDDGNFENTEEGTRISGEITFYFSRFTSVGVFGSREEVSETDALLGSLEHFFNERWAVNVGGGVISHESFLEDETVLSGHLRLRF